MKLFTKIIVIAMAVSCMTACKGEPQRPKILGVAHAGFFTSDFESTCAFYRDFLGYDNPITVTRDDGSVNLTIFKINDRQYVEIFKERKEGGPRLYHFAIETDDAEAMRLYLASKGVEVPDQTPKGRTGNKNFFVTDPNGVICEIVEYCEGGQTVENYGKDMPESRISATMSHVGFQCPDLEKAVSFYTDILGFTEVWRGGKNPEKVSWVHLKAPDSDQTLELMLYDQEPSWDRKGSMNHICLVVNSVEEAMETLSHRPYPEKSRPVNGPNLGINRKRQVNYYDCDGTRVEIMEKETIDGVPAPSSTGTPMKYGLPVEPPLK